MAVRDRIIGGGLLVIGVAIVLILIYLFKLGGMQPTEAYDAIREDLYPAYVKAEAERDYGKMTAISDDIVKALDAAGPKLVKDRFRSDAFSGSVEEKRLYDLLENGTFEKNGEGLYGFKGGWFEANLHLALCELGEAIEAKLKVVRQIRQAAMDAREAIEKARTGSGKALAFPAAKKLPPEDIPLLDPNPIYENDAELYRVFGLPASDLTEALSAPNPGGKATSARLRWNQNVATSEIGAAVASIPELVLGFSQAGAKIHLNTRRLERQELATKELQKLLGEAMGYVGGGLDEPHASKFRENRKVFLKGLAIKQVLEREAKMLDAYMTNVRALGKAFQTEFAK